MEPFLKLVANDLFSKLGDSIQDITIIYPNHRASLFFNKYLSEITSKPLWQPKTTTISELMYNTAQLKPSDPLLLCYKLYSQYIKVINKVESFDDFYFWGNVMISDFDQIDKYLIDSNKIFANISDLKEIDRRFDEFTEEQRVALQNFLNVMSENCDSQIRSRYSQIWEKLGSIYQSFTTSLIAEGIAYEGLAYRIAAKRIIENHESLFKQNFVIVGFNALNSCEKALFNHLKTYCNAIFYWDFDTFYMLPHHEAAQFMSDNLKQYPNQLSINHFSNLKNKKINIIASPSVVTQAKIVPKILSNLNPQNGQIGMDTTIILPDEQLLLPVLSALPVDLQQINITMAYPVRNTSAYSLVDFLLGLQSNLKTTQNRFKFYHKDVLNILGHPYIKQLEPNNDKYQRQITEKKLITIEDSYFAENEILKKIFTPIKKTSEISKYLSSTISEIATKINSDKLNENQNKLELEFLLTIYKALNRIENVIPLIETDFTIKTYRALFRKAMSEQSVSFIGQPLTGLQVMGFLETRNLDFENVIILSMNDSTLPGTSHNPSFITPSLRTAYGLPDYRHQNAIYAYYFYRAIQRANNVNIVYSAQADGFKTSEMSRYILQLLFESNLNINNIHVKFQLGTTTKPTIVVKKTEEILRKLDLLTDINKNKFLSPTSLKLYKNCPLQFFFSKVAGFVKSQDMEETIDNRETGTILHKTIELIYNTIEGEISPEIVNNLIKNTELQNRCINTAFIECFKMDINSSDDLLIGRNKLIIEKIRWMTKQILKVDLQRTPYSIIGHEMFIETTIPITIEGKILNIRLGGYADRIELANGKYRIVDFKTGSYEDKKVMFSSVDDIFSKSELDGVFQLFAYSEIFSRMRIVNPSNIIPNLWFARKNLMPKILDRGKEKGDDPIITSYAPYRKEFMEKLISTITEIFNPEVDFTPTKNKKNCENCNFNSICCNNTKTIE